MGRNLKKGIDYFPTDVDIFQDRKIKRLLRSVGGKGFTIYVHLLADTYREKGYYYEWDEHSAFDISDELNFSESVVEETVKACCSIGLFNEALYSEKSILTAESIQQRWQKIVKDANRTETRIQAEYKISDGRPLFLNVEEKFRETPKKSRENPEKLEETPQKSRGIPQSKGKESKGEENLPQTRGREGFDPGIIDPPDTVDKVIEIGSMKAIPEKACEIYFEMRSVDNFMRMTKDGVWKPIPNWHADLSLCYKKGFLEKDRSSRKNNSEEFKVFDGGTW